MGNELVVASGTPQIPTKTGMPTTTPAPGSAEPKPVIAQDQLKIRYRKPISPENPTKETHVSWLSPDGKGLRNPDGLFGTEVRQQRNAVRGYINDLSKFLNASGEQHQLRLLEGTVHRTTEADNMNGLFVSQVGKPPASWEKVNTIIEGQIGLKYGRTVADQVGNSVKKPVELRLPFKALLSGGSAKLHTVGVGFPGGDAMLKRLNLNPGTKAEEALATFIHDLKRGWLKTVLKEIK